MSRTLNPAFAAALGAPDVAPILLLEAEFASGTIRLWTGIGTLQWAGRTWTGGGTLLEVSPMEEVVGVSAPGASVTLSGVPVDLVQIALAEAQQGAPGRCWLGALDASGLVIADPDQIFVGRLDVPNIEVSGATAAIRFTYEARTLDMDRPREWRYTRESQQVLHPGDRGFEFVTSLQEAEIVWGRS